jgi:hypothetical protein
MPITEAELERALRDRPAGRSCFVLIAKVYEDLDPVLKRATMRMEYPNGLLLLKLPPKEVFP